MAGGTANDWLSQLGRRFEYGSRYVVLGKIDDQIALGQRLLEIIADIDVAGDFVTRFRGGFCYSISHTAFVAVYTDIKAHFRQWGQR